MSAENTERPEWAKRILDALQDADALGAKDDRLTKAERDLIHVVDMRLRHRLGEPGPDDDLNTLAAFVLDRSVSAIAAERAQSNQPAARGTS